MSYEQVGKLIDKWLNDAEFRRQLRADPEKAIGKSGVQISDEERGALGKVDWKLSDEQLKSQISKGM